MGTWGNGIFDDDLALDIRAEFDAAVEGGATAAAAAAALMESELAREILEEFADEERDEAFWEEAGSLFFAVAWLQLENGVLDASVAAQTRTAITVWRDLAEDEPERLAVLDELEKRLG